MRFCSTKACALLVLWQYFQISWCRAPSAPVFPRAFSNPACTCLASLGYALLDSPFQGHWSRTSCLHHAWLSLSSCNSCALMPTGLADRPPPHQRPQAAAHASCGAFWLPMLLAGGWLASEGHPARDCHGSCLGSCASGAACAHSHHRCAD